MQPYDVSDRKIKKGLGGIFYSFGARQLRSLAPRHRAFKKEGGGKNWTGAIRAQWQSEPNFSWQLRGSMRPRRRAPISNYRDASSRVQPSRTRAWAVCCQWFDDTLSLDSHTVFPQKRARRKQHNRRSQNLTHISTALAPGRRRAWCRVLQRSPRKKRRNQIQPRKETQDTVQKRKQQHTKKGDRTKYGFATSGWSFRQERRSSVSLDRAMPAILRDLSQSPICCQTIKAQNEQRTHFIR